MATEVDGWMDEDLEDFYEILDSSVPVCMHLLNYENIFISLEHFPKMAQIYSHSLQVGLHVSGKVDASVVSTPCCIVTVSSLFL